MSPHFVFRRCRREFKANVPTRRESCTGNSAMNPAFSHFIRAYHPVLDACSHRPQSFRWPRFLMLIHRRFRYLEVIDEKSTVLTLLSPSSLPPDRRLASVPLRETVERDADE